MKKRYITFFTLLAILLCFALPCCNAEKSSGNLLKNPGFESLNDDGLPEGWYTDAYIRQEGYTLFSLNDDSYEGSHSACVNNLGMNDARFAQTVEVEPGELYRLSGFIKGYNISDEGRGANVSIKDIYVFSDTVLDTGDQWKYVEMYGETGPDQHSITVFARVGGYSGESTGKALFDSLCLEKVDVVPDSVIPALWYKPDTGASSSQGWVDDDESTVKSFRNYLYPYCIAYALIAFAAASFLMVRKPWKKSCGVLPLLIVGIIAAYILRIIFALQVEGYQVDVNCFLSWGRTMKQAKPVDFYQTVSFCDYTPLYLYALWLNSVVSSIVPDFISEVLVFKQIPILCDLIAALVLYNLCRKEKLSGEQSCVFALLFAFSPAMIMNSALWCQMDSVLCLGLMLVAYFTVEKKWSAVLPVFVLCILLKPQSLMLGFLGLAAIIKEFAAVKESRKKILLGVGFSLAVAIIVLLPFSLHQSSPGWIISLYKSTLSSYPYATLNAANLCCLLKGNWSSLSNPASPMYGIIMAAICFGYGMWLYKYRCSKNQCSMKLKYGEIALQFAFSVSFIIECCFSLSWSVVGATAMAWAFVVVIPAYLRGKEGVKNIPLCGGVLFILLYVLGVKMHERYLFPALIFLAMAFAIHRDRRILFLLIGFTSTLFINEGIILDNSLCLGSSMGHLNNDTLVINNLLSLSNLAMGIISLVTLERIAEQNSPEGTAATVKSLLPLKEYGAENTAKSPSDTPQVKWNLRDTIVVVAVTAIYSVVALVNLGSTKAPQNPWTSSAADEQVVINLGDYQDDFTMLYYCGVSYNDFSVAVSDDGQNWSNEYYAQMAQGQCYRWKYVTPSSVDDSGQRTYTSERNYENVQHFTGQYVRITPQQIGLILDEVIFRDENGEQITTVSLVSRSGGFEDSPNYSSPSALLDEQDTLTGQPGWFTGTYFDEIYHARTAYEHLHGLAPYETSHPPLGKLIMSIGVAIFGMTPFGWRIMGAIVGILMLPVMYALALQLFKRRDISFAAMMMLALDCMHFTQTRIATIDSYPVFFIMLSYLAMLRFMQKDITSLPFRKILPSLALSGFFMGCSIASKWIGCYAAVGLAVLFFWKCIRSLTGCCDNKKAVLKRVFHLCLACIGFFIIVPCAIYLASYVPYFAYAHKDGFMDFVRMVKDAQISMFNYHSTPGLGMDHPFYSPWYEWPLIKRPMYYAMASFVPDGYSYSIFCFGNPAVWYAGLVGIAFTFILWAKHHRYKAEGSDCIIHINSDWDNIAPAFIIIGFLAQFLPWVLVPRGTYIYHYFASIPFLILAFCLLFTWGIKKYPKAVKYVIIVYIAVCLVSFIAWYPYASGCLTNVGWLDFMKKFLNVYHA